MWCLQPSHQAEESPCDPHICHRPLLVTMFLTIKLPNTRSTQLFSFQVVSFMWLDMGLSPEEGVIFFLSRMIPPILRLLIFLQTWQLGRCSLEGGMKYAHSQSLLLQIGNQGHGKQTHTLSPWSSLHCGHSLACLDLCSSLEAYSYIWC